MKQFTQKFITHCGIAATNCFSMHYDSPIGGMTMVCDGQALTALWFDGTRKEICSPEGLSVTTGLSVFDETCRWLNLYFAGKKPDFIPTLAPQGTPFRMRVWEILLAIPYGETVSYGDIARRFSPKMSAQAVGGAVGSNPISIIIPCHRVVGADGSLTGYGGGLDRKRWMLEMETNTSFKVAGTANK